MRTAIFLFFLFVTIAAGILLQIFLSQEESKWLGLILPFITFIFSILIVFQTVTTDSMSWWNVFALITSITLTIVLLAIYFSCREKIRPKST